MRVLGERYRVSRSRLGGGGFGDVYRAVRLSDGLKVAIKILRDHHLPDVRRRFRREVTLLREYQHAGVVQILDADLDASPPYYVMPIYRPLKKRAGKLSPAEFLALFESLVAVLTFLEARGAFHRDLKPDNILIDADGKTVLCDFGLGNDPALTANFTQHFAGTPGYVAPELMRCRNGASPKCDIYSLGATAFHLLTGIEPYEEETLDIAKYTPNFPEEIRTKILEMVHPEPNQRPGAKELLAWVRELSQTIAAPVRESLVAPARARIRKARAAFRLPPGLLTNLPWILVLIAGIVFVALSVSRRVFRVPSRRRNPPKPGSERTACGDAVQPAFLLPDLSGQT